MKTQKQQFNHCHATVTDFFTDNGLFSIFYSYTCPKIVLFPNGEIYKFTFKNSRKEWQITSSKTTSKQCNKRLWQDHHKLPSINLREFEKQYFDTRLDFYF